MFKAPKGPVMCRKCKAVYVKKRWSIDSGEARKLAKAPGIKKILCPACQKIRDNYAEGTVTLKWSDLRERETEIKDDKRWYRDYTGTGNTINAIHPVGRAAQSPVA
jgi:NMD protein affecting ribosome stability and mRNA decay